MSNKKLKLKDLQPNPFKLMLVHPEMGDTDAYVTIVSAQSNAYFLKAIELNKKQGVEMSVAEQIQQSAELAASVVIGWDEEFFDMEFTTQNVTDLLVCVDNFWIRDAINSALSEKSNFFTKA